MIPTALHPLGRRAPPLPYDSLVEYVALDGSQYVDTGVAPGDNRLSYEVVCVNLAPSTTLRGALGCRSSSSAYEPGSYVVFLRSTPRSEARVDIANSGAAIYTAATVGEVARFAWDADTRTLRVTVGGATDSYVADAKTPCDDPFLLGSINTAGTPSAVGATMLIVSARMWLSGVLVRDLVPVRVGTAGALYDRVSGTLYYSATSAALIPGPDLP